MTRHIRLALLLLLATPLAVSAQVTLKLAVMGFFIGVLVTSIVQSSSTTTSIIVGMVAAEAIGVRGAIFMVMGANIGTTVTNTIASFGAARRRRFTTHRFRHIRRAMSGISFIKMHGLGNDFVVLDARTRQLPDIDQATAENQDRHGERYDHKACQCCSAAQRCRQRADHEPHCCQPGCSGKQTKHDSARGRAVETKKRCGGQGRHKKQRRERKPVGCEAASHGQFFTYSSQVQLIEYAGFKIARDEFLEWKDSSQKGCDPYYAAAGTCEKLCIGANGERIKHRNGHEKQQRKNATTATPAG